MAKMAIVDFGAGKYNDAINDNFALLNQDSGWITPTVVAPAVNATSSALAMRLYKGVVKFSGGIRIAEDVSFGSDNNPSSTGVKIVDLPSQFSPDSGWIWCEAVESFAHEAARISIQEDGIYLHKALLKTAGLDFGSVPAYIAKANN